MYPRVHCPSAGMQIAAHKGSSQVGKGQGQNVARTRSGILDLGWLVVAMVSLLGGPLSRPESRSEERGACHETSLALHHSRLSAPTFIDPLQASGIYRLCWWGQHSSLSWRR